VIIQDGMRRMVQEQEDVFYYITVMNENYEHPEMPVGAEADIIKGMYAFKKGAESEGPARPAAGLRHHLPRSHRRRRLLKNDWGVEADLWGCPSFNELARDGQDVARWNLLHPLEAPALPSSRSWPVPRPGHRLHRLHQAVRRADPSLRQGPYVTLGTDGFGRSDTREAAPHFEVDRHWVTLAALKALADEGKIDARRWPPPWSSTTLTRTSRTR
jgi:pyruvate dehydrogenase E1 component